MKIQKIIFALLIGASFFKIHTAGTATRTASDPKIGIQVKESRNDGPFDVGGFTGQQVHFGSASMAGSSGCPQGSQPKISIQNNTNFKVKVHVATTGGCSPFNTELAAKSDKDGSQIFNQKICGLQSITVTGEQSIAPGLMGAVRLPNSFTYIAKEDEKCNQTSFVIEEVQMPTFNIKRK